MLYGREQLRVAGLNFQSKLCESMDDIEGKSICLLLFCFARFSFGSQHKIRFNNTAYNLCGDDRRFCTMVKKQCHQSEYDSTIFGTSHTQRCQNVSISYLFTIFLFIHLRT